MVSLFMGRLLLLLLLGLWTNLFFSVAALRAEPIQCRSLFQNSKLRSKTPPEIQKSKKLTDQG